MSHLAKDDLCESIWEAAQEEIYRKWYYECSAIDRPSRSSIEKMVEEKYQELLSELLEGTL
jgi:hypothetical protein